MSVTIHGDLGVSKVQDGVVVDADIASLSASKLTGSLPAGMGGKVLQVVSTTFSDISTIVSTSYTNVGGASLSITPTSATSKILIIANITSQIRYDATGHQQGDLQLLRGGSSIREFGRALFDYYITYSSTALIIGGVPSFSYLDSPATTSATTYSIQARCYTTSSAGRITINEAVNGSSSITLMEIAA